MSIDELVKAAEQLDEVELGRFTGYVLSIRARRIAPSLPNAEADLLKAINHRLPSETTDRYEGLIAKRDTETLTDDEYHELLRLSKEFEAFDVARVQKLKELADLRRISLAELMLQLRISSSTAG